VSHGVFGGLNRNFVNAISKILQRTVLGGVMTLLATRLRASGTESRLSQNMASVGTLQKAHLSAIL
jgi:hypothetical protein